MSLDNAISHSKQEKDFALFSERSLSTQGYVSLSFGYVKLSGFIHINKEQSVSTDLVADLDRALNFIPDAAVDIIYSEGFWENLAVSVAESLLAECFRVLKPEGRIRIATPDLDYLVQKYSFDWKNQEWLNKNEVNTRGQMLNIKMKSCGHQYLYNEEDLLNQFKSCGFEEMHRFEFGVSSDKRLWNLESAHDSTLILEGIKHVT